MILTEKQIYEIVPNAHPASKNNVMGDCPFCGKENHFYINKGYGKKGQPNAWDCKRCGESGAVYSLLRRLKLDHLIEGDIIDVTAKLDLIEDVDKIELNLEAPDMKYPIGFKRMSDDLYLRTERGFTDHEFNKYVVGRAMASFRYEHYSIIGVTEGGKCKGWLGRLNDSINGTKIAKFQTERLKRKYPRYRNCPKADFAKLLLGYDELDIFTKTAVLVEGKFDKVAVDRHFDLDYQSEVKTLCTFGKKVSDEQIYKMLTKGIENVILIQDPDAINESKILAGHLSKFFNVLVGFLDSGDLDEATPQQIDSVFDNLMKPNEFSHKVVQIRKL